MDEVRGVFGDPHARIIALVRRSKKQPAAHAEENIPDGTTARSAEFATFRLAACAYFWSSRCGAFGAASAVR
jgi:hypothetical protein